MIIYSKRIEMTEIQSHESNNKSHEIDYLADIAVLSKFFFPSHIQYDYNKFYDWSKKIHGKQYNFQQFPIKMLVNLIGRLHFCRCWNDFISFSNALYEF